MKMRKSCENLEIFALVFMILSSGRTRGQTKIHCNLVAVTSPVGLEDVYVGMKQQRQFIDETQNKLDSVSTPPK
mgnify:CR=1 FL=1